MSRRFTTNPVPSRVITPVFLSLPMTATAVASAASEVAAAFTTSTSGMTATGLKKWKPTSRSGCSSTDAIASTESDEVFVARIVVGEMYRSMSLNTVCLTPSSSNTASMTQSQSAKSVLSVVPVTSPRSLLSSSWC